MCRLTKTLPQNCKKKVIIVFCPKCDKFISSSAKACPNCGIEIVSGFSPNLGRGFELDDEEFVSRNPIREAAEAAEETRETLAAAPAENALDNAKSFSERLKSFFGMGK